MQKMTKAIKIGTSHHGNNSMIDVQNRMIRLEGNVQQIQVEIAKINTRLDTELPHLATKADLRELEGKVNTVEERLCARIAKSQNTIVVWLIGFVIATGLMNWYGPSLPHLHSGASTALTQTKMT